MCVVSCIDQCSQHRSLHVLYSLRRQPRVLCSLSWVGLVLDHDLDLIWTKSRDANSTVAISRQCDTVQDTHCGQQSRRRWLIVDTHGSLFPKASLIANRWRETVEHEVSNHGRDVIASTQNMMNIRPAIRQVSEYVQHASLSETRLQTWRIGWLADSANSAAKRALVPCNPCQMSAV